MIGMNDVPCSQHTESDEKSLDYVAYYVKRRL